MSEHVHDFVARLHDLIAPLAIGFRDCHQDLLKARATETIVRREVGSTVKRLALGTQKDREWPASSSRDSRDSKLVTAVNIRPLVAVNFHRDEFAIDELGGLRALVRLAVHHVAPMAPHCPNVEQNWLVFLLRRREGFLAPFAPANRLMHCRS